MKTEVAVTDGVVCPNRERYGEEWQSELECLDAGTEPERSEG